MAVKPRRKASVVATKLPAKPTAGVKRTPAQLSFKPAAPTQPVAPAAPKLATVPQLAVAPPSPSVQTAADRNTTNYQYGTLMGDTNTQLRSLAAQFGGAPKVTQYGYDPNTRKDTETSLDVAANQPGSTMEVLLRNLGLTKGNINDTAESQNTFFSSRRLGNLGSADTQYQGDVGAAKRAYDDAVQALNTAILTGRGTRNTNLTNADITDQQAAAATAPQAQASAPYDPWTDPNVDWNAVKAAFGPQSKPTISAGGSSAQKTTGGSRKTKPRKWAK